MRRAEGMLLYRRWREADTARETSDAALAEWVRGWLFTGFPNSAVIEAALQTDINLVNVYKDAEEVGMFKKYPVFSKVIIPANTYKGVTEDTITFQDSTLWVANSKVADDLVYKLLTLVYSKVGLLIELLQTVILLLTLITTHI